MPDDYNLKRFTDAQERDFATALAEIQRGRKQSHWMWYIFPQVQGLGYSATSKFYAIKGSAEASAYLQHPVLGSRLVLICTELLKLKGASAHKIFGSPDDVKLRSCLTLFASVPGADPVFEEVLAAFFNGEQDAQTLRIIGRQL